jgi:hypothetical protein
MKRFGILVFLLIAGCGVAPTENKLIGTWQVELPPRQKIVYTFLKDHTYTMTISGQAGSLNGTWTLESGILKTTMGSASAYGLTNAFPLTGLSSQKNLIVKLTDSTMVWRDPLRNSGLNLKRVKPAATVTKPP